MTFIEQQELRRSFQVGWDAGKKLQEKVIVALCIPVWVANLPLTMWLSRNK